MKGRYYRNQFVRLKKEKMIEMTQIIAPESICFRVAAKGFDRLRIGVNHPGGSGHVLSYLLARLIPKYKARITAGMRRILSEHEKLFAGRVQALMNSLNEPINRRSKFSGF